MKCEICKKRNTIGEERRKAQRVFFLRKKRNIGGEEDKKKGLSLFLREKSKEVLRQRFKGRRNKTMEKGIFSRDAVLVLAACFCFMSCHTMIIPVLAGFTGSLGGSGLLMGTVVGVTNLVSIGFRIVSGPMVDRVAKGRLSLWGAVLMLAGCAGCALTRGTELLLAARIVHGVGFACCSVGLSTWFSLLIPRERLGAGMGIYGTVQAVALAVAPSLGISMERWLGFRPVFWGAVCAAALIICLSLMVGNKGERVRTDAATGRRSRFRLVEANVIPIALIVTLFTIPYTATQSFLVPIIKRTGATAHAELFFATYAIALVFLRVGFRNYFDRTPYRRFLAICTGSAIVSMLLLNFGEHNLYLVGAAVCMAGGFGIMCSESQATAMAMVDNQKRGLANSTYLIGLDCGMAAGPIIGGTLFGHVAAEYFYPWLMTTAALAGAVYFVNRGRLKHV